MSGAADFIAKVDPSATGSASLLYLTFLGGSCTLNITFAPTTLGSFTAQIVIAETSAGPGTVEQTIPLSGTGTPTAPVANVMPLTLGFSSTTTGALSGPQSVILSNQGSASLAIANITITGPNAQDFTMPVAGTTCPIGGGALAASASCTVAVQFAPQAAGSRTATLNFNDNASNSPQQVTLSGAGVAPPTLQVSPASLTFAPQAEGSPSAPQPVTITNAGNLSAGLSGITLSGANASDFTLGNPCAPILGAGKSCQLSVSFSPQISTSGGPQSATLNIPRATPPTVALTGTATQASISLSASSLNFAAVAEGAAASAGASMTLSVTNPATGVGAGALSFTSVSIAGGNNGDVILGNDTCIAGNVARGGTCSIAVTFAPDASTRPRREPRRSC